VRHVRKRRMGGRRERYPTSGRPWSPSAARTTLRHLAAAAGVRRRFAPTSSVTHTRSRWPAKASRQRQLGHANLGITSIYLQGIDNSEIINTIYARPAPMLPASAGLR
jgi:hypothetical protein